MLQAMLKHCSWQCSSTASSNAQACILTACRVRMVRTTYGEHGADHARPPSPKLGAVTGLILDGKICPDVG